MKGIIGKKVGMTSIFDQAGRSIACTVVHAQPNVVTQVKTVDSDGYDALQLAYGEAKAKNTSNAMQGHFEKAKTAPKRKLAEFRDFELSKNLGDLVSIDEIFTEGERFLRLVPAKARDSRGLLNVTISAVSCKPHTVSITGCGLPDLSVLLPILPRL